MPMMPTCRHLAFKPSRLLHDGRPHPPAGHRRRLLAIAIFDSLLFRFFEESALLITSSAFPPSLSRIGSRGRAEASTMLAARPPCSRVLFPLAFLLIPLVSSPPSSSPPPAFLCSISSPLSGSKGETTMRSKKTNSIRGCDTTGTT